MKQVRENNQKIVQELKKMAQEEGEFPLLLQFYRDLLRVQVEALENFTVPDSKISSQDVARNQKKGLPLLDLSKLSLDWPQLRKVFIKVTEIFTKYPQLFGEIPETLRQPSAKDFINRKTVDAWFTGNKLSAELPDSAISEGLLQSIIHATLKPLLSAYAESLIKLVDQEKWRRSYCPVCGGSPDIAYLDTERGSRWLVCSRCDTEWLSQRLPCPFCGTEEQKKIVYYTDDAGKYRLYTCDQCKRYLKVIDMSKADGEIPLPLERFRTIALDAQAKEQGYHASYLID
ncbi:formate dehydrogenase accessory protein FdhE [Chloroflexota bacterium]